MESDEYLAAFMNGLEFMLLAMEGRLAAVGLDAASEARIDAFVRDYRRVLQEYRARHGSNAPAPSALRVPLSLEPLFN